MKAKITEKPTAEDVMALRLLVRAREDFQFMRKSIDNRIGRKADGTPQNIGARAIRSDDTDSKKDDLGYFMRVANETREKEEDIEKRLFIILRRFPIYNDYLKEVKGVGPVAAAKIIGEIDIVKGSTVSKLWQFCGLNPGQVLGKKAVKVKEYKPDMGKVVAEYPATPTKEASYLVLTDEFIDADKLTPGFVAPFNKNLRTALVGVLADGFIKAQAPYCMNFYYPYKERLEQEEGWKEESKGHRDRAAKRYMIKMFLKDLYVAWRTMEGLEVRSPYQEEYLGHKHVA